MTKVKEPEQVPDPTTVSVFGLGLAWVLATVGVVSIISLAVGVILYTPIMDSANVDAEEQYTLLPEPPNQVVLLDDGVVLEVLQPAELPSEDAPALLDEEGDAALAADTSPEDTAEEGSALEAVVEAVAVALEKAHDSQFYYEEGVCTVFVRDLRVEAVIVADARGCILKEVPTLGFDLMCGTDGQCSKLEL